MLVVRCVYLFDDIPTELGVRKIIHVDLAKSMTSAQIFDLERTSLRIYVVDLYEENW